MPESITPFEPDHEGKVRHIVKTGLKRDVYYRVYVTQVNNRLKESEKSAPAYIRVGDNAPPPTPIIQIDTSVYPTGCSAVGQTCDVYVCWDTPVCDDLGHFELFMWREQPEWFGGNGVYNGEFAYTADSEIMVGSAENSSSVVGCYPGRDVFIGIQAFDTSKNASDISVIKVHVVDGSDLDRPKADIFAEPQGVWAIRVYMTCPSDVDNVMAVEIFRDGTTRIAALIFDKGKEIQWVDAVGYDIGLTHTYSYRYITYDGRISALSYPSLPCTADVIDMSYINQAELEAFNEAWSKGGLKEIDTLRDSYKKIVDDNQKLYDELKDVKEDYTEVFNNYELLINNFEQLSAKVIEDEKTISSLRTSITQNSNQIALKASKAEFDAMTGRMKAVVQNRISVTDRGIESVSSKIAKVQKQLNYNSDKLSEMEEALTTSIKQNENEITLRAVKGDIDKATEQLRKQIVAQIKMTEKSISSVVAKNEKTQSSITQLNDAVSLKVQSGNLRAIITTALQNGISVASIIAQRVVINGECVLQGNARCVGRWASNTMTIVDPRTGKPLWGSDTGTVQPWTKDFSMYFGNGYPILQWIGGNPDWRDLSWVQITPDPRVIFNGITTCKVSLSGTLCLTGTAVTGTLNNPVLAMYMIDGVVNGGQNNNAAGVGQGNAPGWGVDGRGLGKVDYYPTYYVVRAGNGWREGMFPSTKRKYFCTDFSITWEKAIPVWQSTTLHFVAANFSRAEFDVKTIGLKNVRWNVKCY